MIEQSKTGTSESSRPGLKQTSAHWLDVSTGSVHGILAGNQGFGFCSRVDLYNKDCPGTLTQVVLRGNTCYVVGRRYEPQHNGQFGQDRSFLCGASLCLVGCLATSLLPAKCQ